MARILGIDPGSRATGYGVVDTDGQRSRAVHYGVIRVRGELPLAQRLDLLHEGLAAVVAEYAPDEAAIEEVFTAKNARSALVLGRLGGCCCWLRVGTARCMNTQRARSRKPLPGTARPTSSRLVTW